MTFSIYSGCSFHVMRAVMGGWWGGDTGLSLHLERRLFELSNGVSNVLFEGERLHGAPFTFCNHFSNGFSYGIPRLIFGNKIALFKKKTEIFKCARRRFLRGNDMFDTVIES